MIQFLCFNGDINSQETGTSHKYKNVSKINIHGFLFSTVLDFFMLLPFPEVLLSAGASRQHFCAVTFWNEFLSPEMGQGWWGFQSSFKTYAWGHVGIGAELGLDEWGDSVL